MIRFLFYTIVATVMFAAFYGPDWCKSLAVIVGVTICAWLAIDAGITWANDREELL